MLADARHDDSCTLAFGLLHHDLTHDATVGLIKMTDGLVHQDEVERLYECSDHGYSLLLAETHSAYLGIHLVGYTQGLKPSEYLLLGLELGELILDFHILHCRQFGKQSKLLKHMREGLLAHDHPVLSLQCAGIRFVKEYLTRVVLTVTDDIATHAGLTRTAIGLHEIEMSLLEEHILLPYIAHDIRTLQEDVR